MKYRAVIDLYEMEPHDRGYVMEVFEELDWIRHNDAYFDLSFDTFEEIDRPDLANIFAKYADGNETFILLYSW